jgi:Plasmid encoded RepA protein
MSIPVINLRKIDQKRLNGLQERTETALASNDIWFIHTVLAQCFLPYRDPKNDTWHRKNGEFSIFLQAGVVEDPAQKEGYRKVGLPYGPKPRLFQSYICTQVIKQQSPVIPVESSMSAMMQELGLQVTGGSRGTIKPFKEQITRFAACNFTLVGPGPRGTRRHIKTPPIKRFDVWFPTDPKQETLWPSEIVLTDDYYYSLKDHAIPFDFRALRVIQGKPRAQDIYLWMTQRLCRIDERKPLFLTWKDLHEMFGGQSTLKEFKRLFPDDIIAARVSYPEARVEEEAEGFRFRRSLTPIPKTRLFVTPPLKK